MYFVYLVQCTDGSVYTGSTNDIDRRLKQHQAGRGGSYTRSHPVRKIVYTESFSSKGEALKREAEIKRWTRKKKLGLCGL